MSVEFGVLGPVTAWDAAGEPIRLRGPRHRAVLARLIVARGRVVPLTTLIDDLWEVPPADPVGTLRTFVSALRRALEPERTPRAPARLLVTEGSGYALRPGPDAVDAWRFEVEVAAARTFPDREALAALGRGLSMWRGPAYADFAGEDGASGGHWSSAERSRLAEMRLHAVELWAGARLGLGLAADAVPDLDAHVTEHPWREEGWRLLALALYRSGRQGDALTVLRRARTLLVEQLGLEPGPALHRLEADILDQADGLAAASGPDAAAGRAWADAAAAYNREVPSGARARLRSTVELLRSLAVTGGSGLEAARRQRLAAIRAAEELGEPELTARVIGGYDVPAIWSRADEPEQAALVVAAAERTLAALPAVAPEAMRARLLATIALESRGVAGTRGAEAARRAEEIARRLEDPALLAFALNGVFMQSFSSAGSAARRDGIGAELIDVSSRHALVTYEILGHLIRLQALGALGDFAAADAHAAAADGLAERYESPLVAVFTAWYAALRLAASGEQPEEAEAAYRRADAGLYGAGMPGLRRGLLSLALLGLRLVDGRPAPIDARIDWGPYEPWIRPLVLLAEGRRPDAADALRGLPDPPGDHLLEALWCLAARAAVELGDVVMIRRALGALSPAAGELAGAGSGLLTFGPVSGYLAELAGALSGS